MTCYNNGGVDSFGSTLVKYLNQICKQLDINIFPLCCSDSNLRSHKEKNDVGWETVIDTTKIEEIIHNTVNDIFMETGCMIPLDAKERKKICNIVKKSYGLSSITRFFQRVKIDTEGYELNVLKGMKKNQPFLMTSKRGIIRSGDTGGIFCFSASISLDTIPYT